jgi:CHAD domain-containing protein
MSSSAITNRPWLEHLRRNLVAAWESDPVEGVHQVRVAAGRLAVWLRLGGVSVLRDDLSWLRRSAADVRDVDVVMDLEAAAPLHAWLEEERARRRAALERRWRSPRLAGLTTALELLPAIDARHARKRLDRFRRRVLAIDDRLSHGNGNLERLHDLRRALRRWRYALEWLGEPARPVKRMQEHLGELNDLRLVLRFLELAHGELARGRDDHDDLRAGVGRELERRGALARERWRADRDALPWT